MSEQTFTGTPLDSEIDSENVIDLKPIREPTLADKYRLTALRDLTLPDASDYVLKGLADAGALSCWYGAPGAGKSFLMLSVGIAVAQGAEWMDLRTTKGAVFYIALEGANGVRKRLLAAIQEGVLDREAPFFLIPANVDLFDREADTAPLIRLIQDTAKEAGIKPSLIVVDTLARALGSGDENSRDVMELTNNCERMQAETGAHVALVHHSGKDASAGARGHSSLLGAVDAEIQITRDEEDPERRLAKVTKVKDAGDTGQSFPFKLRTIELGKDTDGDAITSCVVEPLDSAISSRVKMTAAQRDTYNLVQNCISQFGEYLPTSKNFPDAPTYGVKTGNLLAHFISTGDIEADLERRKQAAQLSSRIKKLREKGLAQQWDNWIWLTK